MSGKAESRTIWLRRMLLVFALAAGVPLAVAFLHRYPPGEMPIYPICQINRLTGWHCPGCGMTRAAAALSAGDLEQALAYNALLVVLLPIYLAFGIWLTALIWTGRVPRWVRVPGWSIIAFVVVMLAFGVLRNVPSYPFSLLAPHELARP